MASPTANDNSKLGLTSFAKEDEDAEYERKTAEFKVIGTHPRQK